MLIIKVKFQVNIKSLLNEIHHLYQKTKTHQHHRALVSNLRHKGHMQPFSTWFMALGPQQHVVKCVL